MTYFNMDIEQDGNLYTVHRPLHRNSPCQWHIRFVKGSLEQVYRNYVLMTDAWLLDGRWVLRVWRNRRDYDRKESNLDDDEHKVLAEKYSPLLDSLLEMASPEYEAALAAIDQAQVKPTIFESLLGCACIFGALLYCFIMA